MEHVYILTVDGSGVSRHESLEDAQRAAQPHVASKRTLEITLVTDVNAHLRAPAIMPKVWYRYDYERWVERQ